MAEWNEALRYDYPLNEDSVVFDVGGFHGEWASCIYAKYSCSILIFEPVREYYNIILNKFHLDHGVTIFNFGLGTKDQKITIGVTGSSTSVFNTTAERMEEVRIIDILPTLSYIPKIDLIKINIEGAEYDLLDYIIENGLQTKLVNIQVQFHMNVEDYENRRQRIREELAKTHHLTYDFAYTHENWELNNSNP